MPDAFEFPGTLRAVVVLVRRQRLAGFRGLVVEKHVALALRHAVRPHEIFRLRAGRVPGPPSVV